MSKNKKSIQLIFYAVLSSIVLLMSAYYTYYAVQTYLKEKQFQENVQYVNILQQYENRIVIDSLCMVLPQTDRLKQWCSNEEKQRLLLREKLKEKENNLFSWIQKIESFRDRINTKNIENMHILFPEKAIHSGVKPYLEALELQTEKPEEKEILYLYEKFADVSYANALEYLLVNYYLHHTKEVSPQNLIYWDKIIQLSSLPQIEDQRYIGVLKESLLRQLKDRQLQKTLQHIDDMRIAILTGQIDKARDKQTWQALLKQKENALEGIKSTIINTIIKNSAERLEKEQYPAVFFFILLVMALLALFWIYRDIQKENNEKRALSELVFKLSRLSSYSTIESEAMHKMLLEAKNKSEIYQSVYSSFQLLSEKHKQAQDEAKAQSDFLSTLSHEIRTPINGILGFVNLLKEMGTSTDEQKEFLALIESGSQHLIDIANDVLNLSKMNADKMEVEKSSFNLMKNIENIVSPLTYQADQKDIELSLFVDPSLRGHFLGDGTKISQVMTNLLSNAVKFTEAYGKINIFVQCMHEEEKTVDVKFAVNDNGIGLSPTHIQHIFNAFSQATKQTGKKYGGTGLGLSISYKMVELMGGRLEVESKEGRGSTFFFTLTLEKDTKRSIPEVPKFSDITVGLALPVKGIKRQIDSNLEIYMRYLGASFSVYYYDDLFAEDNTDLLPDIMVFDHHYARLSGELEQCASLSCKTVLLTNGTLRARINPEKHDFADVILNPVTLDKSIRILNHTVENHVADLISEKDEEEISLSEITLFSGLRALVADDNMINRKLIKIVLENLGLEVTLCSNGEEALKAYMQDEYDVVFMDIQMPVMDGIAATHEILKYESKANKKHTPIIALTANAAAGDKEQCLNEGMDDYMSKPLELDILHEMLTKYCKETV